MAWSKRHLLKCNGGPGLSIRKPKAPTAHQAALQALRKRLRSLGLPLYYAEKLQSLRLRPRQLGITLRRLMELRATLEATEGRLSEIRSEINGLLNGGDEQNAGSHVPGHPGRSDADGWSLELTNHDDIDNDDYY